MAVSHKKLKGSNHIKKWCRLYGETNLGARVLVEMTKEVIHCKKDHVLIKFETSLIVKK